MNLKDAREYIKKAYEQRFVDLYEESVLCKTHDKIIQAAILQCQLDTWNAAIGEAAKLACDQIAYDSNKYADAVNTATLIRSLPFPESLKGEK